MSWHLPLYVLTGPHNSPLSANVNNLSRQDLCYLCQSLCCVTNHIYHCNSLQHTMRAWIHYHLYVAWFMAARSECTCIMSSLQWMIYNCKIRFSAWIICIQCKCELQDFYTQYWMLSNLCISSVNDVSKTASLLIFTRFFYWLTTSWQVMKTNFY